MEMVILGKKYPIWKSKREEITREKESARIEMQYCMKR